MRQAWLTVLGESQLADDDDFFELGGHSLAAVEIAEILRRSGVEMSPVILLQYPRFRDAVAAVGVASSTAPPNSPPGA